MNEKEIRETASFIVDKIKQVGAANREPTDDDKAALIIWGTNLAVQLLVDINRQADALERIALVLEHK